MSKINKKLINERTEFYYLKNNHLNYHNFGEPDIYDSFNREYKIFYEKDNKNFIFDGLGSLKLNVKIPKNSKWFDNKDLLTEQEFKIFSDKKRDPILLKIQKHYRKDNRSKTGYVFVNGNGLKELLKNLEK